MVKKKRKFGLYLNSEKDWDVDRTRIESTSTVGRSWNPIPIKNQWKMSITGPDRMVIDCKINIKIKEKSGSDGHLANWFDSLRFLVVSDARQWRRGGSEPSKTKKQRTFHSSPKNDLWTRSISFRCSIVFLKLHYNFMVLIEGRNCKDGHFHFSENQVQNE